MVDIGRSKRAEKAYSFDEVAIVPSRRTRGIDDVDVAWKIDAVTLDFPLIAAPMDSVMSPATVIAMGELGGLGVLNCEGLWGRYEDPSSCLAQLAEIPEKREREATVKLQEIYAAPLRPELVRDRLAEIHASGVPFAAAVSPKNAEALTPLVAASGADFLVIRGTTVSAEHISTQYDAQAEPAGTSQPPAQDKRFGSQSSPSGTGQPLTKDKRSGPQPGPLDLKQFIKTLDVPVIAGGCANYHTALHLMRSGVVGVLVGFGGGARRATRNVLGIEVPMATAVSDVAAARRDYLDESGGRYVHVIADGSLGDSGDIAKALALGADAAMIGVPLARSVEAPGLGFHWGPEAWHATLPRGLRAHVDTYGTLREILLGPASIANGSMNLVGALRRTLASTGYDDLKHFQRADLVVV